jgi:hypothetical protein
VSYARDVAPILQRCVLCHHPGNITGYDLVNPFDPVHGIVGRSNDWHTEGHNSPLELVVKPGSPDESFLIYKVAADPDPLAFDPENNGDPMPPQIARVTTDELANVKQWIADGAHDDAFFSDSVAPIFGTDITLGRREGKCTLCHYPSSQTGLNILAPFDATLGLVGVRSLLSVKPRVQPGSPENSFLVEKIEAAMPSAGAAMPLHYERLNTTEVEILRRWIAQGALDD